MQYPDGVYTLVTIQQIWLTRLLGLYRDYNILKCSLSGHIKSPSLDSNHVSDKHMNENE